MTDWVHCNKCFKQPTGNGDKFNLTNCGHFICETCATEKPRHCFQCESSCETVTLSPNLDEDIRNYFSSIDDHYDQIHKLLKNMIFQKNHRQNLFTYLCKENKKYSKELQQINYKYAAAKKYIKQIHEENKRLRDIVKNIGSSTTPASNQGHNVQPTRNNSFMNTGATSLTFHSKKSNQNINFVNTPSSKQSNYFQTPTTSDITFKSLFIDKNHRNR